MQQPDRIHLRDHVISAEIGAFQSERGRNQRLRFGLSVDLRDPVSGAGDEVDSILSYDVLTQAIDTALAEQRYDLVETLAERIAAEVLAHSAAARIEVTVEKLDRGPGALGVTISRDAARIAARPQSLPVDLLVWSAPGAGPQGPVVIVPGTPPQPEPAGIGAAAARRIALLALDQAAWALAGTLGLEIAETRTELEAAIRGRSPVVWAPARLAAGAAEAGQRPDTLAFWLAERLSAQQLRFALPDEAPLPVAPAGFPIPLARA
ncbi:dihydroneopterin aldolase [Paracoccus marinaquae]|uniref:dihydroneopterin aldolase n=1 Tax=Paracoccus marinaquae TaxID=2841926 RepID=A0ABS6AFX8_9RHOB|nr:dihydroneopterin aldolase [Paracoccus marinaquae]MBU3029507.1 dihydroneopterin aldolase [Paracoccus marinaquae]